MGEVLGSQFTFTDHFFAIAHDPETCQPRLHTRVLGLGLASGLLCELILERWIGVTDGAVYPLRYSDVPAEPLRHRLYQLVRSEAERWQVDVWLRYLAPDAPDLVGDRLVMARHYRRESVRSGLLRRPVQRYRPVDPARAAYAVVRLRTALLSPRVNLQDLVVMAIAVATELADDVLQDDAVSRDLLPSLFRRLPKPVWEVITHTQACVAHHVMTN